MCSRAGVKLNQHASWVPSLILSWQQPLREGSTCSVIYLFVALVCCMSSQKLQKGFWEGEGVGDSSAQERTGWDGARRPNQDILYEKPRMFGFGIRGSRSHVRLKSQGFTHGHAQMDCSCNADAQVKLPVSAAEDKGPSVCLRATGLESAGSQITPTIHGGGDECGCV